VSMSLCLLLLCFLAPQPCLVPKDNRIKTGFKPPVAKQLGCFFDVYNARLFANKPSLPEDFLSDAEPLKLELCYLKAISANMFIEGANKVLPKTLTATLQNEVNRLHQSYQPVEPEDCYVLEYTPQSGTQLKLNNQTVFSSQVEGFKAVYFGVWLGENPLSESLKSSLLVQLISSHIVR